MVAVSGLFWRSLKFLRMMFLTARLLGWKVRVNEILSLFYAVPTRDRWQWRWWSMKPPWIKKSQGSLPSASKYDLAKTMAWNKSLKFPEIFHWSITRWHKEICTHLCLLLLPHIIALKCCTAYSIGHEFSFDKNMTKRSVQFLLLLLIQNLNTMN